MRKWTKPVLTVEKMELSQSIAAGCGDFDYFTVSCTVDNNGHNYHPNKQNPYEVSDYVKNLSAEQAGYITGNNKDWQSLIMSFNHGDWSSKHHVRGYITTRHIPSSS